MPPSNIIPSAADAPLALTAWEIPGLVHGFCGRAGGVSAGPFASFNLAEWVGDEAGAVAENRRRWDARYPNLRIARLIQVHSKLVRAIDLETFPRPADSLARPAGSPGDGKRLEGDGMVTATPGIALGIFTADCVPILMVDAERHVVGALHAGWRGTLAGIAGEGVRAMVALGARTTAIRVALGPSIGICCVEVDASLAEQFALQVPAARDHTRAGKPGKAYLDLRAIIRDQLEREGLEVASIANVGPCTRCANDAYFSRRAASGATSGLQMSFIGFVQ
jgi:YfiH family protein